MANVKSDDSTLIDKCLRGDRDAYDALVRLYERRAYQFAYRLCNHNADDAGDVVADAFLRVYSNLKSFRREASFITWLYRIITNVYLDMRKRERLRAHESLEEVYSSEDGDVSRQIVDPSSGPHQFTENAELRGVLNAAIARLPDYQRAMVLMYHVDGLSYEEISAAMNMPLGTVKSRLNRARLALRELLAEHMELFR